MINHSLLALVASASARASTATSPITASRLTRLLEDSLSGSALATMICAASPPPAALGDETLQTLARANEVKQIKRPARRRARRSRGCRRRRRRRRRRPWWARCPHRRRRRRRRCRTRRVPAWASAHGCRALAHARRNSSAPPSRPLLGQQSAVVEGGRRRRRACRRPSRDPTAELHELLARVLASSDAQNQRAFLRVGKSLMESLQVDLPLEAVGCAAPPQRAELVTLPQLGEGRPGALPRRATPAASSPAASRRRPRRAHRRATRRAPPRRDPSTSPASAAARATRRPNRRFVMGAPKPNPRTLPALATEGCSPPKEEQLAPYRSPFTARGFRTPRRR